MERGGAGSVAAAPHDALVRILADAATLPDAAMRLCELVARHFAWDVASLWLVDEAARLLRLGGGWCADDDGELIAFRRVSERLTFARGVGLPGTVWESGELEWISDVMAAAADFPRVELARENGLGAAVALPLTGPGGVLGVMELMSRGVREPVGDQPEAFATMGREIGQFVARMHAEDRLRASEEMSASIVRAALDCIVTMDHEGRVTDFNPAAESTFGCAREEVVGRPLAEVIIPPELRGAHQRALERYVRTREETILNRRLELEGVRADGTRFPVELTVTRLGQREPPVFAGFIRDITDRQRSADEVERLLEREHAARVRAEAAERDSRSFAETLQRGLSPAALPAVPGVQLGAVYRAGEEGSLVGGDFYDVFALGGGRWGIAIGDVRGKGPQAAAVTAMMRWTIRTAAQREAAPERVLEIANAALLGEAAQGDYCTAIYGCLAVEPEVSRLRLAVAGHPLPLLRSAGGGVSAVGAPGTMLGAVADPRLEATEVALGAGDAVLFYTDGITECRTAEGFFGGDRLGTLLEDCGDADAAAIARRIDTAVVEAASGGMTDDIAVLVVRAAPGA